MARPVALRTHVRGLAFSGRSSSRAARECDFGARGGRHVFPARSPSLPNTGTVVVPKGLGTMARVFVFEHKSAGGRSGFEGEVLQC
jgi:hypothetical protein